MFKIKQRDGDLARARLVTALVGYGLGVPVDAVRGDTRGKSDVAFARQVAMYLAHVSFEMSLARVAAAFGRDRSTVGHACHLVEDKRDDLRFDAWIERMEETVRAAPLPSVEAA